VDAPQGLEEERYKLDGELVSGQQKTYDAGGNSL
jgi:hypothetical protein